MKVKNPGVISGIFKTMTQKIIHTEAWIGEFGWELFCWQGFLRTLQRKTKDEFIITCRTGHDYLYEDFASEIRNYDPKIEETDMWKNHANGRQLGQKYLEQYCNSGNHENVIFNNAYPEFWWKDEHWKCRQEFIKYGNTNLFLPSYDVLIHARNTDKCHTGFRNWPANHLAEFVLRLLEKGLTVACIGKSDSSYSVSGIPSHMDIPLKELADLMNNARILVGSQSGVSHFAALCQLPQICWQTKAEHADRVMDKWNPFHTLVLPIPAPTDAYWTRRKMWLPEVELLVSHIEYFIMNPTIQRRRF